MKLPFLSKINSISSSDSSDSQWLWPSYCHQPKTLSFRHSQFFKTINTAYDIDPTTFADSNDDLWSESATTALDESSGVISDGGGDKVEKLIRGLKSERERLFFEPGETSSIMQEAKTGSGRERNFEESRVLSMESKDPYVDFQKSMLEMVEAYGLRDSWEGLEELLSWYLKVNDKQNHGCIASAFVDLLVTIQFASSSSSSSCCGNHEDSPTSPLSFCTFSCNSLCGEASSSHICEEEMEISTQCSSSSF